MYIYIYVVIYVRISTEPYGKCLFNSYLGIKYVFVCLSAILILLIYNVKHMQLKNKTKKIYDP